MLKFTLKEYMDQSGMSIQAVADKTGISRTTISAFYNEKSQGIQFDTLNKLVNGLGVEVYELFENVFPKDNLRVSIGRMPYVKELLSEDEPTFEADFFYPENSNNDSGERITIIEFKMPLFVQLDKVNSIQALSIFLSYEEIGDNWQGDVNEHKLTDFLSHTANADLEPYLISVGREIYSAVEKQVHINKNAMVIFKSDVGNFSEEAGPFPIIFNWPVSVLSDDKRVDDYLTVKYKSV